MSMPLSYKDLRDELDLILWHFNVPKILRYQLLSLRRYFIYNIEVHSEEDNNKVMRGLEIINEIMPPNKMENSNEKIYM